MKAITNIDLDVNLSKFMIIYAPERPQTNCVLYDLLLMGWIDRFKAVSFTILSWHHVGFLK